MLNSNNVQKHPRWLFLNKAMYFGFIDENWEQQFNITYRSSILAYCPWLDLASCVWLLCILLFLSRSFFFFLMLDIQYCTRLTWKYRFFRHPVSHRARMVLPRWSALTKLSNLNEAQSSKEMIFLTVILRLIKRKTLLLFHFSTFWDLCWTIAKLTIT